MSKLGGDLKIVVMGKSSAGKTSFILKWTKNNINEEYKPTIVEELGFKIYEKNGKIYRIQYWDLAGQDENNLLFKIFANDAHGCIIVSDATNIQMREE